MLEKNHDRDQINYERLTTKELCEYFNRCCSVCGFILLCSKWQFFKSHKND